MFIEDKFQIKENEVVNDFHVQIPQNCFADLFSFKSVN